MPRHQAKDVSGVLAIPIFGLGCALFALLLLPFLVRERRKSAMDWRFLYNLLILAVVLAAFGLMLALALRADDLFIPVLRDCLPLYFLPLAVALWAIYWPRRKAPRSNS